MSEPIIKREQLRTGGWNQKKAWLILTPTRLLFTVDESGESVEGKGSHEIPIASITSARAKKAFAAGTDALEVQFTAANGKVEKQTYERSSAAQWANGGRGRVEPNSLASWEQTIDDVRFGRLQPSAPPAGDDFLAGLERLAALHAAGSISDDEFALAKRKLLA